MSNGRAQTGHEDIPATVECTVTSVALSHIGMRRTSNQDSFCALVGSDAPPGSDALLAVADGMGGHKAGEVASEMAIRGLIDGLSRGDLRGRVADDLISQTFNVLNTRIHTAAALPETCGMGTTLTAAVIVDGALTVGHVGDSRAYLLREGVIRQLTQDHSWVAEQVANGLMTSGEAEVHPGRNILTRAIGVAPNVLVDSMTVAVKEGDLLLVCSDGVHSLLGKGELVRLLSRGDLQSSSQEIVNLANARGGNDNITVVISRIDCLAPSGV